MSYYCTTANVTFNYYVAAFIGLIVGAVCTYLAYMVYNKLKKGEKDGTKHKG